MRKSQIIVRGISVISFGYVVALTGCGDGSGEADVSVERAALITNAEESLLAVPAYFPDSHTQSWSQLTSRGDPAMRSSIVIVNPSSGPGSSQDPTVQSNIKNVLRVGGIPIGYVPLKCTINQVNYDRTASQVMGDVAAWKSLYPNVVGIFFDVADRTDTSWVGAYEYYANEAQQTFMNSGLHGNGQYPGYTFFNPGENGSQYQQYVDCTAQLSKVNGDEGAARWVLFEGSETSYNNETSSYQTDPNYTWVMPYDPIHFVHLVYQVTSDGSTVGSLFAESEARNAASLYLTDQPGPPGGNPWGDIASLGVPPPNVWSNETSEIYQIRTGQINATYPGNSPDTLTAGCPSFVPPTVNPAMCPS